MKRLFTMFAVLFLAATAISARAQAIMNSDRFGDYRLGIQLGFNIPSFGEGPYSGTLGWNLGLTGIYNTEGFIPNSYVRASALYTRKGASASNVYYPADKPKYRFEDATFYLHYFEIPVRFGYAYELLNDDFLVFAETGPYLAFRLTASQRFDKSSSAIDGSDYVAPRSMKDTFRDLRRFDIGWGVHAGVLFMKKYQASLGYDWGLCDAVPGETGRNLNLNLNVAVYFD